MDPTVDSSEVVNLAIALLAVPVLLRMMGPEETRRRRSFSLGYLMMLLGLTATIVEGFVAYDFFNLVEHALYAVAGIAFAVAMWHFARSEGFQ